MKRKNDWNRLKKIWKKRSKKNSWAETLAALLGVTALAGILEIKKEINEFVVSRHDIKIFCKTAQKSPVRMIFLSDLHGKSYGKENSELIAAIRKERPDVILIGGDLLTRSVESSDQTAKKLLRELVKVSPVYMANGNHEQKLREYRESYGTRYQEYREFAEQSGVHILENESECITVKGVPFRITGLEIPLECYGQFSKRKLKISEIEQWIGQREERGYQILLAHNPAYMKEYLQWGADLVLSGHLHGGIVRMPGIGGVITPQMKLFPKYSGDLYRENGKTCIVSRGLGTHTVNLRFHNSAEVVSIAFVQTEK